MPVAKVYLPEGLLTPDQRREIVRGIHDVIVSVEKRPAAPDLTTISSIRFRHSAESAASRMRAAAITHHHCEVGP